MMDEISVESLLSMAVTIETNGAEYYRWGAENAPRAVADELLKLAEDEEKHKRLFQEMKCALKPEDRVAIPVEMSKSKAEYLHVLVNGNTIINPTATIDASAYKTPYAIFNKAIDDEKDTIVFYQCIKTVVEDKAIQDKIDEIIDEEVGHVMELCKKLELYKD